MAAHKKFMMTTGTQASEYWLAEGVDGPRQGLSVDAQGNAIVGSYLKVGLDGEPIWSIGYSGSPSVTTGASATDYQDIYVAAAQGITSQALESSALLMKLDQTGSMVWQRTLNTSDPVGAVHHDYFQACAIDTSGNVLAVGGQIDGLSSSNSLLAKYNSSGTLQWQASIEGDSPTTPVALGVDTSDDIMIGFRTNDIGGDVYVYAARYQSDGTYVTNLRFGNQSTFRATNGDATRVKGDSLGNIIFATEALGSSISDPIKLIVCKINSANSVVWKREIFDSTLDTEIRGTGDIACDRFGNIYVAASYVPGTSPTNYEMVILKYNSSGVLQWQKSVSDLVDTAGIQSNGIAVANNGDVYVLGSQSILMKIPSDGSGDGTYGGRFVYADSSFTEQASSIPVNSGTLLQPASTLTSSTASVTITAGPTVTTTVYPITP